MKNPGDWTPSKYAMRGGRLVPSRDHAELSPASRLIAWLLVDRYDAGLATHARGVLLDLGCGKVPFYAAYRDRIADNVCVDWPGSPHSNLHLDRFCDLSQPLPFPDASFDTVLSSDVIEHLPDPDLAFAEMGRVLRPGGKLILNTPFLYMLHEMPHDFYRHTRYSLERLAAHAGLDVVELEEIGGIADVLSDLVGKALSTVPVVGTTLSLLAQAPAIALRRLPLWRRLSRASAARFPLGYFLVARKPPQATHDTSHDAAPEPSA